MNSGNHTPIHHLVPQHNNKPADQPVSRHAESEPFAPSKNHVEIQKVVEHEVSDKQVQPHVEVRKDVPEIPPDLQQMGITTNAASQFPAYQKMSLPLDEEKLPVALKSPLSESIRWLGELTLYLIEQSRGTVSTAHKNILKNFIRMIGRDFGK